MAVIKLDKDFEIEDVLRFATEKHKGQKRDGGEDYISHPIRVAKIVDEYKAKNSLNKKVLIAAALLHDTLEDTYTSYNEIVDNFGEIVASIVMELTTAKYGCKIIGKAQYLAEKMQFMTNYALFIKLADRLDNLCDMKGCTEEKKQRTIKDTIYIMDYLQKRRTLTKSQKKLADSIKQQIDLMLKTNNEQK